MPRWIVLGAGALLLASILPAARPALGQGAFVLVNERNHPELAWWEIATDHFRIFYHDPLEPWARDAASILERHHRPLCRLLDVEPRGRTRVYLSDQDQIANGMAVGWDYFIAWVPSHASHRSFAGGRTWFEEVLLHEYTHILISEASRTWLGNVAFLLGLYPPRWIHEGICQWAAEPWSVLRGDRELAAAVLDGSIDRNPPGVPGGARLRHYVRGHARIRWLAQAYGDTTVAALLRPRGPLGVYTVSSSFAGALGRDAGDWEDRFRREMIAFYGERFRRGEPPDSIGRPLETGLAFPARIVAGDDSVLWCVGQRSRGPGESSLFRRAPDGRTERVIEGAVSGAPLPLEDGTVLVPRMHRVEHGSWVQDLVRFDPETGRSRFVTSGERIGDPVRLAGDRIGAIADTRYGPTLVAAPIPDRDAPLRFVPLGGWSRGWVLHGLAASPDGSRAVVSATAPDGDRSLTGLWIGLVGVDSLRLTAAGAESRGAAWIDRERIAWTSHRGGIEQVRTGWWPHGGRLLRDEPRTAHGVGAGLAGTFRDSLLILDRASRMKVPVRIAARDRTAPVPPEGPVHPFGAAPAVEARPVEPRTDGPFPYRPLAEVRPWFRIPLAGPQSGQPAVGFAGIWAEPLLRHAGGGYLYASPDQARHPDRGLFYLTTRWGPWAAAFHSSSLVPRRLLAESILVERREATGLALLFPLSIASDPNWTGWADLHLKAESRRPRFGGRRLATPAGPPAAWSSLILGGGAGYLRIPPSGMLATGPTGGHGAQVRMQGGAAATGGAVRFARGRAEAFLARPLPVPAPVSLWGFARIEAASAELPPQEFVGLDADPSHRWLDGWPGLDGTVFLRGWPTARAARAVAAATIEARIRVVPDLGIRGPGIGLHGGTLAPFLDLAHPWGGRSASFLDERIRATTGMEVRLAGRVGPLLVVPAVAWGRPIGGRGPSGGSWSWRIETPLPFATPLRPPAFLRALLGGALQGGGAGCRAPELLVSERAGPLS